MSRKTRVELTEDEIEVLLDALRFAYEELNDVNVDEPHEAYYWVLGGEGDEERSRSVMCREWHGGEQQLCEYHTRAAELRYPQGWRGYPGDTCRHGVYTGGSGIDWMCGPCELGDDDD